MRRILALVLQQPSFHRLRASSRQLINSLTVGNTCRTVANWPAADSARPPTSDP